MSISMKYPWFLSLTWGRLSPGNHPSFASFLLLQINSNRDGQIREALVHVQSSSWWHSNTHKLYLTMAYCERNISCADPLSKTFLAWKSISKPLCPENNESNFFPTNSGKPPYLHSKRIKVIHFSPVRMPGYIWFRGICTLALDWG